MVKRVTRRTFLKSLGGAFVGAVMFPRRGVGVALPYLVSDGRRGIYLTTWIAQSTNTGTLAGRIRTHAIDLLTSSELNAVVIDVVVDRLFFPKSVQALVRELKRAGVWCAARIVVCQNNEFAKLHPESALVRASTGKPWVCTESIGIDPASPELVEYVVGASKRAVDFGFDEVQYDYIRFPADCRPFDIRYPIYDGMRDRREIIRELCQRIADGVRSYRSDATLSIDVFCEAVLRGYGDSVRKDIGQDYRYLDDIFDVVCPMVYPSHYYPGSWGIAVPAAEPYAIVSNGLSFFASYLAKQKPRAVVRPWLQYFSLKSYKTNVFVAYDETMIVEQRRALDDLRIDGFCYWDPRCRYDRGAFREHPNH